jgi:hypothetical protein
MGIVCNCPAKCEIHPKYPVAVVPMKNTAADVVPKIDAEDKLTLKVLEVESLKAQAQMETARQQLMQRALDAHHQLEQFVAAMFDKHGLKQSEYVLDLGKLEFINRPPAPEK